MKRLLTFPLRLFIFWLLFFALFRLWFVLWFHQEWAAGHAITAWYSFWYALPLDLSMAAYLVAIPFLLWLCGWPLGETVRNRISNIIFWYNVLWFGLLVFVFGANVFLYEEWHTPLNNRALEYIKTPDALLDSMGFGFKVASVLLYIGFVWLVARAYRALVGQKIYPEQSSRLVLASLPLWLLLIPLAIRGGLGVMPINESAVYYSSNLFDNHAATNTLWHLLHSMIETRQTENHFRILPDQEADTLLQGVISRDRLDAVPLMAFFEPADSARLNVVFIIMESMTAQVIEELGGEKGVCPNLSRLIREGILFTNCYGSGYRTDQGIVSVLAGYPAQPDQSIVLLEDKASKLGSMSRVMKQEGYSTAFFYGGELTFANIGAWLRQQQFEKIFSIKDFPASDATQRWGVDDRKLLNRAIAEISSLPQPFFSTAMTLSQHPPYDVPFKSRWQADTDREKFLNSAAFADDALGEFFQNAEKQPWYNHTLFVLVADHGVPPPSFVGLDNPISRQVPWIIFGKPLRQEWHGRRIPSFCNHHDIAATVLSMLHLDKYSNEFPWSRNQWQYNPNQTDEPPGFAMYDNENGLGWLNKHGKAVYFFGKKEWHFWSGKLDEREQQEARAYLQEVYADFLRK